MREIKFRGKRIDDGKWFYGDLSTEYSKGNFIVNHSELRGTLWHSVIPETVGQYTGLKDENGVDIYEGDILHCESRLDNANLVVIFEDGEFRQVLCEKYKKYISGCGYRSIGSFQKEIIGNIFDNPELLEVD